MDLSAYKAISIGGIAMKKLTLDGVQIWKSGPTNWVRKYSNADGTIYNGGLGYKNGYRIRSGGAEGTDANASCTGFMKVNPGDEIRIAGWAFANAKTVNSINVSNSSFENIGQFTMAGASYGIFTSGYSAYNNASVTSEKIDVCKWIVPPAESGVSYIRVTGYTDQNGQNMIVTINEEI